MTALGLAAGAANAAEYETPASRPAREAVPASLAGREDVRVADPVATDGYMYIFTVQSPYGEFKVTGIGALNKLAHEIWAIGELRQITRGEAFLEAAKNQLSKPVVFAKDLVTQPGETLRGIPAGVGRLFGNVSAAISSPRKPSQDSRAEEMMHFWLWAGRSSRADNNDVGHSRSVGPYRPSWMPLPVGVPHAL
jgi:hypothetical protein